MTFRFKKVDDVKLCQCTSCTSNSSTIELHKRINSLEDRIQILYLEHELKIAALLEHFERQQKTALEFVPVEAVAAKIIVRRRDI